ncbi:hypothetical protein [Nitrosomonas aestuarii]|uniref:hypothetical protein n=1 Tax=Nitrosomonas aestuarii TaxID=52441 RepID=UPI000D400B22|nr:hypothetical protein [Nitrosomonas aestuarii]PTN06810.1 hypothetical protein C8R11_1422 [Nitrosomonas aestuarii]
MSDTSTYSLRLPKSLKNEVVKMATRDGTSLNQFIAMAVAEKVSALETEDFFKELAKQLNLYIFFFSQVAKCHVMVMSWRHNMPEYLYITGQTIYIMRILHESMDHGRHL